MSSNNNFLTNVFGFAAMCSCTFEGMPLLDGPWGKVDHYYVFLACVVIMFFLRVWLLCFSCVVNLKCCYACICIKLFYQENVSGLLFTKKMWVDCCLSYGNLLRLLYSRHIKSNMCNREWLQSNNWGTLLEQDYVEFLCSWIV